MVRRSTIPGHGRLALLLAATLLAGCGGSDEGEDGDEKDEGVGAKGEAVFGLAGGPNSYQTTTAAWKQLLDAVEEAGGTSVHLQPLGWGEAEIAPGVFNVSDFDELLPLLADGSMAYTLDVGTPVGIESTDLPADMTFTSFDDPELKSRYEAYVTATLATFPKPTHVILHTETASHFLGDDSAAFAAYCDLLSTTVDLVKAKVPGVKVGVYATEDDSAAALDKMTRNTDYFSFGYNANRGDVDHRAKIEALVALAGDRKFGVHEIGIPTAARVGGSETKQVEFVNLVFDLATAWGERLEFLAYYQAFDEDPAVTEAWLPATFPDWTDEMKADGIAWFGSLGLQTYKAEPKPAWATFKERIAAYNGLAVPPP
jgi:hypothetical protein